MNKAEQLGPIFTFRAGPRYA